MSTAAIRQVVRNGVLYDDDMLVEQQPAPGERPPFWWWQGGPNPHAFAAEQTPRCTRSVDRAQ